jgi:hypothetical protein
MQGDESERNREGRICSGEVDVDVQLIDRSRSKRMWRWGSDSVGLGRGPVVWYEHSDKFSGCHKCSVFLWSDCSFLQKVRFRSLWRCSWFSRHYSVLFFIKKRRFGDWTPRLSSGTKLTQLDPMHRTAPYLWTPEPTQETKYNTNHPWELKQTLQNSTYVRPCTCGYA